MNETVLYDADGNAVTLDELCRREPAWAASRIRVLEAQAKHEVSTREFEATIAEARCREFAERTRRAKGALADIRRAFAAGDQLEIGRILREHAPMFKASEGGRKPGDS
jgi:hypothetical protein